MKYLYTIPVLALLALSSCRKDGVTTDLDRSLKVWTDFKASAHNTYTYTAHNGSWTGYYVETRFTVVNGKVIAREMTTGHYKPNSNDVVVDSAWKESGATLNMHTDGHPSLTIDDLYSKARREWLAVDRKKNDVYFEAGNNGILSSAGYVPKGCQDDCFVGVKIKEVKVYVKEIK